MRTIVLTVAIAFGTLNATWAAVATPEVHRHNRKPLVSRQAALGIATSAAIGQATNSPHEWGRGAAGFGKRLGSSAGHYVVKDTIERGVGAMLHEERTNYVRADKPGFGPKFKSAAENTFLIRHKNSDKKYPAVGRISGHVGSGMVSRLWQPARLRTVSSGFATAGVSLGGEFGWNLAREYMPPPKPKHVAHTHPAHQRYTRTG